MRPPRNFAYLLLAGCLLGVFSWAQASTPEKQPQAAIPPATKVHSTDDVDVTRETQISVRDNGRVGLIWWIPMEFWLQSAEKQGTDPQKAREQFKALKDYTVLGVFVANVSQLGAFDYVAPADLQKKIFLRDSAGQDYPAITDVAGDAKSLADLIRPMLANAMGRAGENFAMIFFPAKDKSGALIADATSKSNFSFVLKDIVGDPETVFVWRTPLTSLSPPRYCPAGKERVHADWDYCPRHGVKLNP